MFEPITTTSPRKEKSGNRHQPAHDSPQLNVVQSTPKPGVDGLPLATLLGAIIAGIIMWIGIFALGYVVLDFLF